MGKEQRAVYSGGLVVEVEAAVWLKLCSSPSRVEGKEEVVGRLAQAHCRVLSEVSITFRTKPCHDGPSMAGWLRLTNGRMAKTYEWAGG